MRVKHKVWVNIAKDTAMEYLQFGPTETKVLRQIDTYTKQSNHDIAITQGTSEDLSLGDITAVKGIFLEVSADCIVKLNGSTDSIQLRRAGTATTDVARLFLEADISQVNITAPADVDITGVFAAWGDIAA